MLHELPRSLGSRLDDSYLLDTPRLNPWPERTMSTLRLTAFYPRGMLALTLRNLGRLRCAPPQIPVQPTANLTKQSSKLLFVGCPPVVVTKGKLLNVLV